MHSLLNNAPLRRDQEGHLFRWPFRGPSLHHRALKALKRNDNVLLLSLLNSNAIHPHDVLFPKPDEFMVHHGRGGRWVQDGLHTWLHMAAGCNNMAFAWELLHHPLADPDAMVKASTALGYTPLESLLLQEEPCPALLSLLLAHNPDMTKFRPNLSPYCDDMGGISLQEWLHDRSELHPIDRQAHEVWEAEHCRQVLTQAMAPSTASQRPARRPRM